MKVSKDILKDWKENLDSGDKKKLVEYCDYSHPMITEAFEGNASEDLIIKINKFFEEKKNRVSESFKK